MPDALGQRFTYRRPQHPPHAREQEKEPDQRRHLVDDVVGVGHPRWNLHHVDALRLSPGPSFPASPSRALASNRSAKSTRSASSATSRRSSSSPALRSPFPPAPQPPPPRRQLLSPRRERGARVAPRLQLGGVRFAQGPDDQPAEKAAEQDDGDQHRRGFGVHPLRAGPSRSPSRCLASSRSAKSNRSARSPTC